MKKTFGAAMMLAVLMFAGWMSGAQAQTADRYTTPAKPDFVQYTSSSVSGGHSVYVYRLTGSAATLSQQLTWLEDMNTANTAISSITVNRANNTCTVELEGIGGAERAERLKMDLDQYIQNQTTVATAAKSSAQADLVRNASEAKATAATKNAMNDAELQRQHDEAIQKNSSNK